MNTIHAGNTAWGWITCAVWRGKPSTLYTASHNSLQRKKINCDVISFIRLLRIFMSPPQLDYRACMTLASRLDPPPLHRRPASFFLSNSLFIYPYSSFPSFSLQPAPSLFLLSPRHHLYTVSQSPFSLPLSLQLLSLFLPTASSFSFSPLSSPSSLHGQPAAFPLPSPLPHPYTTTSPTCLRLPYFPSLHFSPPSIFKLYPP